MKCLTLYTMHQWNHCMLLQQSNFLADINILSELILQCSGLRYYKQGVRPAFNTEANKMVFWKIV